MVKGAESTQTHSEPSLLIVDDERHLRFTLGEWARDSGLRPIEAASGREALEALKQGVDAVLLDLRLGDEDGLQVLRRLREEDPTLPIVMLTGHGTIQHAMEATRLGAYDFIQKPADLEHLGVVLKRALEHARLQREVDHFRTATIGEEMLGDSDGFRRAIEQLDKAAKSPTATVLIQGETGSGKELMAQRLHRQSARRDGPFITLNCSAIPEQLLEKELFGNERGAFTDAKSSRKGLFDLADGGTLFLDEIGEMPTPLQAKLLRVLQDRTFRRVGGHADIRVDVRIVSATHRDLKKLVVEGRFREDLYFRLNVVPIVMPPLRERTEDVKPLAEHFIKRISAELGRAPARLQPDALRAMLEYAWPGNIRELRNLVERVLLLEADDEIRIEHLPPEFTGRGHGDPEPGSFDPFPPGIVRPLAEVEQMAIVHALRVNKGNKTRAAEQLGISRQTLRTKLKEYQMGDDPDPEAEEGADQ
jgi:two-component system, NtrC family, response regulator AtoC